jgi:hypothetical protein
VEADWFVGKSGPWTGEPLGVWVKSSLGPLKAEARESLDDLDEIPLY